MEQRKGIILMFICTFFTAFGQYFLKLGSSNIVFNLSIITNYNLIAGFAFYGFGAILMITALKYGELNTLYPIISITFIWVSILSIYILKESTSPVRFLGIASILTGVVFLTKGAKNA